VEKEKRLWISPKVEKYILAGMKHSLSDHHRKKRQKKRTASFQMYSSAAADCPADHSKGK